MIILDFNSKGKVILSKEKIVVNHTDEWKAEIDLAVKESKAKEQNLYKHEPYLCEKCNIFHAYLRAGKVNMTHKKHFNDTCRFKSDFSQAELFKLGFKKSWKREGKKIKKPIKHTLYIN